MFAYRKCPEIYPCIKQYYSTPRNYHLETLKSYRKEDVIKVALAAGPFLINNSRNGYHLEFRTERLVLGRWVLGRPSWLCFTKSEYDYRNVCKTWTVIQLLEMWNDGIGIFKYVIVPKYVDRELTSNGHCH